MSQSKEGEVIYRKVSVKDRLPNDDYPVHVIAKDDRGVEYVNVDRCEDGYFEMDRHDEHEITYWLEEIPLSKLIEDSMPSEEEKKEKRKELIMYTNSISFAVIKYDEWLKTKPTNKK